MRKFKARNQTTDEKDLKEFLRQKQLKKLKSNKQKDILKLGPDKPEEEVQSPNQSNNRSRVEGDSLGSTSINRHFSNGTGLKYRKSKATRPTEMPVKLEYPWEACEPVLAVKSKRRATSKHYPVKKILKEGD